MEISLDDTKKLLNYIEQLKSALYLLITRIEHHKGIPPDSMEVWLEQAKEPLKEK